MLSAGGPGRTIPIGPGDGPDARRRSHVQMEDLPRVRVLLVEDRPVARKLIEDDLVRAGRIEVAGSARDGDEALRLVRTLDPDVVLMDVVMPGKDGIRTLCELRQFSDVPVVVLTAAQIAADTLEHIARRSGADAFFRKPSGNIPLAIHTIHAPLVAEIRRLAGRPRLQRARRVPNA